MLGMRRIAAVAFVLGSSGPALADPPLMRDVPDGDATIQLDAGWSEATEQPIAIAAVELRVWRKLYAIAGVQWTDRDGGTLRPSVGIAYPITDEIAASFQYKPEGFNEPEGELELGVAGVKRIGRTILVGNLAYGQDPEAREQDAEEGAGVIVRLTGRVSAGVTERARFSIGAPLPGEPRWDVVAGPHAAIDLDHVIVVGFAGFAARRLDEMDADAGIAASLGVSRTF